MPTSPSQRRAASKAPPPVVRTRSIWPRVAVICVIAVAAVVVAALPASLVKKFLPPAVQADDFSGTLWHGSAGRIGVLGRDAGALEWHLHPAALFKLRLDADLHWVKGSFVLDGTVSAGKSDVHAQGLSGGGPIADLASFGLAPSWRGVSQLNIQDLAADRSGPNPVLRSAVGEIDVSDLSSPQMAAGSDIGNYALTFNEAALTANSDVHAALVDKGGPLAIDATITLTQSTRTGLLSGTVKARDDAPPALRKEIDNVAQLHAPDAQGRIPIDLEFTF